MNGDADLLVEELTNTLRDALEGVRFGREIAYWAFTENGGRELTARTARVIRGQDRLIGTCERAVARGEAWCGHGPG